MPSVTNIVDIISYVLIAFVAISLIVSSIMIGYYVYQCIERKKEIGILRQLVLRKEMYLRSLMQRHLSSDYVQD